MIINQFLVGMPHGKSGGLKYNARNMIRYSVMVDNDRLTTLKLKLNYSSNF